MSCNKMIQTQVKKQLQLTIDFLENNLTLTNGHMVDFFTKSLYKTIIPNEMRKEINKIGCTNVVELILNQEIHENVPILKDFIDKTKQLSLYNTNLCINLNEINEKLHVLGCKDIPSLKIDVFMKPKKSHEVETLSNLVAKIASITDISHLIDIGDGKGYLSSLLAFNYKIPVLGVDSSVINTEAAFKRAEKLGKQWKGILKENDGKQKRKNAQNDTKPNLIIDKQLYKQITQYITQDTNFNELISNAFSEPIKNLGLIGLHTCGDLAPSSLRIFNKNQSIKSIINVGCCYHLLNERFFEFDGDLAPKGFPMSAFLFDKEMQLGRTARMLSAQSVDRILSHHTLPNKSILYRAIFEVVLNEFCEVLPTKNVGRFRKESINFIEYARVALKRLDLNVNISDEQLNEIYFKYQSRCCELNVFHLLRSMLAPVIEALILLDRFLFLLEAGHTNVFLVQLFDPIVSPRCYGLVAYKN